MASLSGINKGSFDVIDLDGSDMKDLLNAKQDQANAFDGQYSSLSGTPNIEYTSPIPTATTSSDGLMASSDKSSLDGKVAYNDIFAYGDQPVKGHMYLSGGFYGGSQQEVQVEKILSIQTDDTSSTLESAYPDHGGIHHRLKIEPKATYNSVPRCILFKADTYADIDETIQNQVVETGSSSTFWFHPTLSSFPDIRIGSGTDFLIKNSDLPTISQSLDSSEINVPSNNAVLTSLSAKQNVISTNDLTISQTNGLQTALDGKQNTIQENGLTISKTNGLQTALDAKQNTIQENGLTISKTNGLQTALDAKVNKTSPHFYSDINSNGSLKLGNDGGWYQTIEWRADQQPANSFIAFKLTNLGTETEVLKLQGDSKVYITGDLDVTGSVTIPDATIDYNTKLANKPTLSTVAASGSYTDLTNKPSIPTTISYQLDNLGTYQLSGSPVHDMNSPNCVYNFSGSVNNNLISHTANTEKFTINQSGWFTITVMLMCTDGASNNRSLIYGRCEVFRANNTVKNKYMLGSCYYRDDNNNYDDCIINNTITVFLEASQWFQIETMRSYTESSAGAINATVSASYINIEYATAVLS